MLGNGKWIVDNVDRRLFVDGNEKYVTSESLLAEIDDKLSVWRRL